MPTYSYKCTACDNAFDIVQSFSDSSLTTCEVCGGTLRKVFSPVGVTFNGSGFYRTDSRGKPASSSSSSSDSGSGSGSGSGKSDTGSASGPAKSDSGAGKSGSSAPSTTSAPAASGAKS